MTENLITLFANLWVVDQRQKFLGIEIGTRMTVVRLESGDLFLHSPIPLTNSSLKELAKLGNIKFIIAPNRFHHLYVGDYINLFPDTKLYAAPGLPEKRNDLTFDGVLDNKISYGWESDIQHLVIGGIPLLNEVVFFHRSSHTLIVTDLLFNIGGRLPLSTKIFAWLDGCYGRSSVPRLIRYFALKDKVLLRESVDKILEWEFDRVILAHGNILETGGHKSVRRAFEWL